MRSTLIAVAITGALSLCQPSLANAQQTSAYDRCFELAGDGQYAQAEPFCKQARHTEGERGLLLYADFLLLQNDLDGAIAGYSDLLKKADERDDALTPTQQTALRHRALAYSHQENTFGALADVARLLEELPDDIELLEFMLSKALTSDRKVDAADRLIRLRPDHMPYRIEKIRALLVSDQGKAALEAAQAALKQDPSSTTALSHRGFAYAALNEYAKAEKDHAAVSRKLPNELAPKANRAEMLLMMERFDDAIRMATEVLSVEADHPQALQTRAVARVRIGDAQGALADIELGMKTQESSHWAEMRDGVRKLVDAQAATTPQALAALERDHGRVIDVVASHLRRQCGTFYVGETVSNDELNAYRDCILKWYEVEEATFKNSLPEDIFTTAERISAQLSQARGGADFVCSKMPKKARCIDDAIYARVESIRESFLDPVLTVGNAEFERLNQEVLAYNARIKRVNALVNTANFLQALSNALAEQSGN